MTRSSATIGGDMRDSTGRSAPRRIEAGEGPGAQPPGKGPPTGLGQIAVCLEGPPGAAGEATIGGGVAAILTEIATLLERVAATGEAAAIDLRSLPMSAADRRRLLEALGPGEVEITLRADGHSSIRETGVHGVWWTEHRDRNGTLIACFIEIARVPEILLVSGEELRRGAGRLRAVRDA